ncbi:MAG: Crp/Fnr family transcriptional regulator [Bacteroidota bacterium]
MHSQLASYIKQEIPVSEQELDMILGYFVPVSVHKNEILLNEGDVNSKIIFVCKGCLRIYFNQEDGQEATRYLAFENQFATALVSFISRQPSFEFIQALEPSDLLCITYDNFMRLLEMIPTWERFYRQYLEKAYVTNTNRLMSFTTMDASTRYEELLLQNAQVVERLPNRLVASYLNISQETLSRIKGKKQKSS